MKQHITAEDLNQLSEEGKEKLRAWWEPDVGNCLIWKIWKNPLRPDATIISIFRKDISFDEKKCYQLGNVWLREDELKQRIIPLLSIGQMIELLSDRKRSFTYEITLFCDGTIGFYRNFQMIDKDELCDALWEAVKAVLEG